MGNVMKKGFYFIWKHNNVYRVTGNSHCTTLPDQLYQLLRDSTLSLR